MSWDELRAAAVVTGRSAVETARFGRPVARVVVGVGAPAATGPHRLTDELTAAVQGAARSADVVVVRYPASSPELGACIARAGLAAIPAGSLTYWELVVAGAASSTPGAAPEAPEGDVDAVPLAVLAPGGPAAWGAVVDDVVADSFSRYANHYSANPLIDPSAALAGYQEWARSSARRDPHDVLVLREGRRPVGVATLRGSDDGVDHVEVLLAGLVRSAQGRGLYLLLLAAAVAETRARSRRRLVISTQSHNVRVQRSWAGAGLRPFSCIETVHAVRPGLLAGHPG